MSGLSEDPRVSSTPIASEEIFNLDSPDKLKNTDSSNDSNKVM